MSELKDMEINGQRFGAVVEAILFASDKPLTAHEIASVITSTELSPPIGEDDVANVINELNAELEEQGRAFTIQVIAGGYVFATQPKYHSWLEYFQHQNAKRKISPSAVEALAIVAYRQPITKPEVDHIRGVDSGYILRQLLEKDLIEVAGRYEGPGRALLYRTTPVFLQHFGINSIDELPKPREIEEILRDDDMAEHRQLMLELKSELRPPMAETGGMALSKESSDSGKTDQPDESTQDDAVPDETENRETEPRESAANDTEPTEAEPGDTQPRGSESDDTNSGKGEARGSESDDTNSGKGEARDSESDDTKSGRGEPQGSKSDDARLGESEPQDTASKGDEDAIWLDFGNDTDEDSEGFDHDRKDEDSEGFGHDPKDEKDDREEKDDDIDINRGSDENRDDDIDINRGSDENRDDHESHDDDEPNRKDVNDDTRPQ